MFADILREREEYMKSFMPFSPGMEFKYIHLHKVIENAEQIAEGECFTPEEAEKLRMAALIHDIGRFEQQRQFSTFDDSISFDHSEYSCKIAKEKGWTDDEDVLEAVRRHNKSGIPVDLSPRRLKIVLALKDADRLDILRGLEAYVQQYGDEWRQKVQELFQIDPYAPPSEAVCELVLSRKIVDFKLLHSVSDCTIMQIGWVLAGFHFATTCRLAVQRGHLEFRRRLLKTISDSPLIDKVCDIAALSNFYRGLAGLMAAVVMADGFFQPEEEETVERVFHGCARNRTEYAACMASFGQALSDKRGIPYYAALCRECGGDDDIAFVIDVLEKIVAADGVIQSSESQVVQRIREALKGVRR